MPEGSLTSGRCGGAALPGMPFGGLGQALPDPLLLPQSTGAAHQRPPDGRTLPGSDPVRGVAQSDASGSSGSSGRPRAVRTARPGRSIARSAADHSSVPSSSTPAAAAPTA